MRYYEEIEKHEKCLMVFKKHPIQDRALYISKAQYDNEYKIYQEIWTCMLSMFKALEEITLKNKYKESDIKTKCDEVFKMNNDFLFLVEKYSLFYKEEYLVEFYHIGTLLQGTLNKLVYIPIVEGSVIIDNDLKLELNSEIRQTHKVISKTKGLIKEYLNSLRLDE